VCAVLASGRRRCVAGWLVGFGQALGGSGAYRSRVGGSFGEGESLGARRRRSRWGPFGPFGRRARSARVTERLVRAYGALGARGASRSRVRGSVGAGRRVGAPSATQQLRYEYGVRERPRHTESSMRERDNHPDHVVHGCTDRCTSSEYHAENTESLEPPSKRQPQRAAQSSVSTLTPQPSVVAVLRPQRPTSHLVVVIERHHRDGLGVEPHHLLLARGPSGARDTCPHRVCGPTRPTTRPMQLMLAADCRSDVRC